MRLDMQKGRYRARLAATDADLKACQSLRHLCFFGSDGCDADVFDPHWQHLMVEDVGNDMLVCTMRCHVSSGTGILGGYAAGYYDLQSIAKLQKPTLEIGRFCCHPAHVDPHILRVAWGALTRIVESAAAVLIFGCTSFHGNDPAPHAAVFQRLRDRYLGPVALRPGLKAAATIALSDIAPDGTAQSPMPPLLRTYLAMGGWVSDHAVIDHAMGTLHVLTALETASVPAARANALRALA